MNEPTNEQIEVLEEMLDLIKKGREAVVGRNICDTCGKPYTVNENYDKHDCEAWAKVKEAK